MAVFPSRARLFRSRVQLLTHIQVTPDLDSEAALARALTTELYREVAAMNCENFIVRMQLKAVERFQQRESWERLTVSDVEVLQSEVAGLPSEIETDDIELRLFDLTALKMQLALAEGDMGTLEQQRRRRGGDRQAAGRKEHDSRSEGPTRLPGFGAGERLLGKASP